MNISSLQLIKIQYELSTDELDRLLYKKMTEEEKKWTFILSKSAPNESISDEYDVVHDIVLVDVETKVKIKNMLNRLNLKYKIYDISEIYVNFQNLLSPKMIKDIDEYIVKNTLIDDVLDRINEVGYDELNVFEKKFLNLQNGNDSKDK